VRAFAALALVALCALLIPACRGGSDGATTTQALGSRDFKAKAIGAIASGSDLHAEPGFGLKLDVSKPDSFSTLVVPLDDAYKRYQASSADQQAVLTSLVEDAEKRMDEGNSGRSFSQVEHDLLPVLKRRSVVATSTDDPAVKPFDDLSVIYGVQRPDSFTVVTKDDLKRWGRSVEELDGVAIANLEKETNAKQKLLCEPSGGQKLCGWASGDGYDATRMLVPGLRRQIADALGGPAVYAVPLESVFVALARNYADVIKNTVLQQFTTGENPLSPELFVERDGRLVTLPE
jgi:uncharacterized protein YtpQ (UPF0354 family)